MKKIIPYTFAFIVLIAISQNQVSGCELHWPVGETLTYQVKYSFIRLGTLRMVVKDTLRINHKLAYHTQVYIDSDPLLFWVNHHSLYESIFFENFEGCLFKYDETVDETPFNGHYQFDYTDSLIHIQMVSEKDPDSLIVKHNPFSGMILDGISLLYYSRYYATQTRIDTVAYLADAGEETAIIEFEGYKKNIFLPDFKQAVKASYLKGHMTGEGIAGLSGFFKGYFAIDNQRPPLKAHLKVFIGFITLYLESWEKWTPDQ